MVGLNLEHLPPSYALQSRFHPLFSNTYQKHFTFNPPMSFKDEAQLKLDQVYDK